MQFKPKSESEVQEEQLCPEQKAPFTVLAAAEKTSKTGKAMIALKLNVHAEDGFDYHVYDYISPEFMAYKFRHFFYSTGQGQAYETGTIAAENLVNRQGWCDVGIQKAKGGYGPKNIITDYVLEHTGTDAGPDSESSKKPQELPAAKPTYKEEDDVPF